MTLSLSAREINSKPGGNGISPSSTSCPMTRPATNFAPRPRMWKLGALSQIELGRKERVRQVVRRHLRTPTLGPRTLCRIVGMSRSNLIGYSKRSVVWPATFNESGWSKRIRS